MSEHKAWIEWKRTEDGFLAGQYSREHTWEFDGGVIVQASPSPSSVRPPFSNPAAVDPEEAFVAAVASCHMLTFLFLASRAGFQVDRYQDAATGRMTPNQQGIPWVSHIELRPQIVFSGERHPSHEEIARLHHRAHEECYIANSIRTAVTVW